MPSEPILRFESKLSDLRQSHTVTYPARSFTNAEWDWLEDVDKQVALNARRVRGSITKTVTKYDNLLVMTYNFGDPSIPTRVFTFKEAKFVPASGVAEGERSRGKTFFEWLFFLFPDWYMSEFGDEMREHALQVWDEDKGNVRRLIAEFRALVDGAIRARFLRPSKKPAQTPK
jgi:hypothetical protein